MLNRETALELAEKLLFTLLVFLVKKLGLLDKFVAGLNKAVGKEPVDKNPK